MEVISPTRVEAANQLSFATQSIKGEGGTLTDQTSYPAQGGGPTGGS